MSKQKFKLSEIDENIANIFDIKKRLGKGAYGIVWKAIDKRSTATVAVKKIFDAFRNETDAQRTFREIMFLRAFRNHDNIIQLRSIHRAENHMDIYLSFDFMESDLHNVIKKGSILKDVHKQYVMYQLLNATMYIHSGNVIHRDLKPSNILIDSRCRCKIADFGLARSLENHNDKNCSYNDDGQILTDYVATRWYRAPEILVACKNYTKGIDLWSLGCILGEMLRGTPLFPGTCSVNQIERILSALPKATSDDIESVGGGFGTALFKQNLLQSCDNLDDLLISSPNDGKDLVKALLVLDPNRRLTAKQALEHTYLERFRHVLPEPELRSSVITPFRDDIQLSINEYRSKLYELIASNGVNGSPHCYEGKPHKHRYVKNLSVARSLVRTSTHSLNLIKKKSIVNIPKLYPSLAYMKYEEKLPSVHTKQYKNNSNQINNNILYAQNQKNANKKSNTIDNKTKDLTLNEIRIAKNDKRIYCKTAPPNKQKIQQYQNQLSFDFYNDLKNCSCYSNLEVVPKEVPESVIAVNKNVAKAVVSKNLKPTQTDNVEIKCYKSNECNRVSDTFGSNYFIFPKYTPKQINAASSSTSQYKSHTHNQGNLSKYLIRGCSLDDTDNRLDNDIISNWETYSSQSRKKEPKNLEKNNQSINGDMKTNSNDNSHTNQQQNSHRLIDIYENKKQNKIADKSSNSIANFIPLKANKNINNCTKRHRSSFLNGLNELNQHKIKYGFTKASDLFKLRSSTEFKNID